MGDDTKDLMVTPPPRPRRYSTKRGSVVPASDIIKLHESISKVASAVNRSARHTEQIPEIKKRVESTSDKVVALDTKMESMTDRVTRVEDKVDQGHDCYQAVIIEEIKTNQRESSQKIELDVQKGIKQSGEIAILRAGTSSLQEDLADIKRTPRRMFFGLIGVIVTIAISAGGAVWFLAQLENDVRHEREQRVGQFKRIEVQIKTIAKNADPAPVKKALKSLEEEIESSNGHEKRYDQMCEEMSRVEKRFIKKTLAKRRRRVPLSCL